MAVTIREPQLLPEEDIKKFAGRWVAIKDGKVLFDADDPEALMAKLEQSRETPDIVRKLPTRAEPEVWAL